MASSRRADHSDSNVSNPPQNDVLVKAVLCSAVLGLPATHRLNDAFIIGNMSALIRAAHPLAYVSADLLRLPPAECQHPHERVLLFFRPPLSAHDPGDSVCVIGKKQVPH